MLYNILQNNKFNKNLIMIDFTFLLKSLVSMVILSVKNKKKSIKIIAVRKNIVPINILPL